ncbi:MAG TPA: lamin tail domain-containing protein [Anaerolineales bacterium]|nr:lamin tail domain-containing protein [Anaerolineales bacterium]
MDRRRLILYLLLNVFISACVTGAILFWYDRNYRATALSSVPPASVSNNQSASAASYDPQVDIPVEIVSIVGAGTLNAEWVVVRNAGTEPLSLAGWQLKDSNKNVFTFPNLTLNGGGAVQIHSISGTNTVIDLYWGETEPVWQSGEEAQLLDPKGNMRALYKVP